jgi:hypothetical protein
MSVNAVAQNVGAVMLHSDALATSCNITGNPSTGVTVYVYHSFHNGVTLSNFKIEDKGANFTHLADVSQAGTLIIGTADVGASYAYPFCAASDHHFVRVLYNGTGTAGVCSSLEVVPSPLALSGTIEGVTCAFVEATADGSNLTVNCPDIPVQCGRIVPVESTNWGKVKALYK